MISPRHLRRQPHLRAFILLVLPCAIPAAAEMRTGAAAMMDWTNDAPGVQRKITVADLPPPNATPSANESARLLSRPDGAWPKVPDGFKVDQFVTGLKEPRVIVTAPNGDLFVAESAANRVRVLRDANGNGKLDVNEVFVSGLDRPFGIAFYPAGPNPRYIYIANTGAVVPAEQILTLSAGGHLTGGGHWTRDIVFSLDGRSLFVSIGSKSNDSDDAVEDNRARIFQCDPDGHNLRVYASGIRNPVGLAIDPATGGLWTSVNERDGLGDIYGWPWFYLGNHPDPRHLGKHPELASQVLVPDVLIAAHSASLDLVFYDGRRFPAHYRGNIFAGEHGSWNRSQRTGYKVIMVPVTPDGSADGSYEDFMTGFVTPEGRVWGRPVGVTVGKNGELFVTDDGSNSIWRVTYPGK
jgi:glucose/arabinose dehydrogenase